MNIQLIEGAFNKEETIGLVTQFIQTKIGYHENKIAKSSNEEDIKYRESKIKQLQQALFDARTKIVNGNETVKINTIINIS